MPVQIQKCLPKVQSGELTVTSVNIKGFSIKIKSGYPYKCTSSILETAHATIEATSDSSLTSVIYGFMSGHVNNMPFVL